MDASTPSESTRDPLDHPLYRIAHLHGSEWVTLTPEGQHSPREDEPGGHWANASVFHCETCGERVMIAPD